MPSSARKAATLAELPQGRRGRHLVAAAPGAGAGTLRPDLTVVPMRGNVETRLRKLEEGAADATLLACAGLRRLGLADRITVADLDRRDAARRGPGRHRRRDPRSDDAAMAELLAPINHEPTALAVTAERAFLAKLEGSCRTPIAGLAELAGGRLVFRGTILTPDGRECHATRREGRPEEALSSPRTPPPSCSPRPGPTSSARTA